MACAQAEKYLQKWQGKKWGKVGIVRLNTTVKDWHIAGYSPKATPAYLLVDERNTAIKDHEGVLNEKELEAFLVTEADHEEEE